MPNLETLRALEKRLEEARNPRVIMDEFDEIVGTLSLPIDQQLSLIMEAQIAIVRALIAKEEGNG